MIIIDHPPSKFTTFFCLLAFILLSSDGDGSSANSSPESYTFVASANNIDGNEKLTDSYPNNLYWGDTHVHTYLSSDAYSTGTRITLDQAYRFAKGERVRASGGQYASLRRPLDFLMIADHAEDMGAFAALSKGEKVIKDKNKLAELIQKLVSLPTAKDIVNSKKEDELSLIHI